MKLPIRILHLEDDPADARLIHALLRQEGLEAEITTVGERQAFLSALQHNEFGLILSDFKLPGYDGLQALAEWRGRCPEKPFVFVTGSMGEELAIESLRSGAVDYVLKSNLARLAPAIRRALAEARERAHRQQAEADLREAQRIARLGDWRWDTETDATTGSDELYAIFGLDPATQSLPSFHEQRGLLYPLEAWDQLHRAAVRTLETGVGFELDVQAFRGRTPIWVTARGEAARNGSAAIVGLHGTIQDITARKQSEEEQRLANQELARFNQVTLGRELRIIELKKQVNKLCARLGEAPIFRADLDQEPAQSAA
jgi:CheY-like chemotaxis protein